MEAFYKVVGLTASCLITSWWFERTIDAIRKENRRMTVMSAGPFLFSFVLTVVHLVKFVL